MMFPFKRAFPTALVCLYLNISDSGLSIFKIRLARGGKTYIPASLEIKTHAIEHFLPPTPRKKKSMGFCTINWVMHIPQAGACASFSPFF